MAKYEPGQLVWATAGRDRGRLYLVWETNEDFCLLADGRKRKLANPKRKRPRHLTAAAALSEEEFSLIRSGIKDGSADAKIRRALAAAKRRLPPYLDNQNQNEEATEDA